MPIGKPDSRRSMFKNDSLIRRVFSLSKIILLAICISDCTAKIHEDQMNQGTCNDFIQSLIIKKSHKDIPNSFKLFGQFVGIWEWAGFDYGNDGNKIPTKGKWIFEWVLNGNAIQDVFIFEDQNSNKSQVSFAEYGTTIRFPNNDGNTWKSVWVGPMNKVIRIFDAKAIGSEILLEGKNERNKLIRWVFSDITENSFHWRGEYPSDKGVSWLLSEELDARKCSCVDG